MATLLDTDVAIHLQDGDSWIEDRARQLEPPLFISTITRIELENGVWREPEWVKIRQATLDQLLSVVRVLEFGASEVEAYRQIVANTGYSCRKTADRITAATALVHKMRLVTLNGRDFRDVSGLKLIEWSRGS